MHSTDQSVHVRHYLDVWMSRVGGAPLSTATLFFTMSVELRAPKNSHFPTPEKFTQSQTIVCIFIVHHYICLVEKRHYTVLLQCDEK